MKILIVGPSIKKSKGGISSVIDGIKRDDVLNKEFQIDIFPSYIDGNIIVRISFSVLSFVKFLFIYRKYDLFHIHMASYGSTFRKLLYGIIIKRAHKKMIIHIHGAEYLVFFKSLNKSKKKIVTNFIKNADMIIALSESWKSDFKKIFKTKKITVLNNGIDHKIFEEAITDINSNISSFLFLGRLNERKGIYDLLDSIELIKDYGMKMKFYLAGDGEVEKIKKIIRKRKLEQYIEILGWITISEKIEILRKVAVLVLPSYHEGLPMALIEGMAAGKGIITTNVGAISDLVINNENGIIIPVGDVNALKDALIRYSINVEELKIISSKNLKKIRDKFSLAQINIILSQYYNDVINS